MEAAAAKAGVSATEWKQFIAYAAGFYGNMGNYHNFGANKFIPELSQVRFSQVLKSNPLYSDEDAFYKQVVDELLPQVEAEDYNIDKPYA